MISEDRANIVVAVVVVLIVVVHVAIRAIEVQVVSVVSIVLRTTPIVAENVTSFVSTSTNALRRDGQASVLRCQSVTLIKQIQLAPASRNRQDSRKRILISDAETDVSAGSLPLSRGFGKLPGAADGACRPALRMGLLAPPESFN